MSDGEGCTCAARSAGECCCDDVDWTPQEVLDLRAEVSRLTAENERLARAWDAMQKSGAESAKTWLDSINRLTAELAEAKSWLKDMDARYLANVKELDSLHAQEPVAWLVICKASGLVEQAEPNEKATNPEHWTDAFPVFANPVPVAQAVPEGWRWIPATETEAMHDAVMSLLYKGVSRNNTQALLDAYLAAAPQPPVSDGDALLYATEANRSAK